MGRGARLGDSVIKTLQSLAEASFNHRERGVQVAWVGLIRLQAFRAEHLMCMIGYLIGYLRGADVLAERSERQQGPFTRAQLSVGESLEFSNGRIRTPNRLGILPTHDSTGGQQLGNRKGPSIVLGV